MNGFGRRDYLSVNEVLNFMAQPWARVGGVATLLMEDAIEGRIIPPWQWIWHREWIYRLKETFGFKTSEDDGHGKS